jgi:hypothetical protein
MTQIANSPDDSIRQQWSQHYLNNAYDYVPMADPVRGIFGATPVETMHTLRKGIIEVVTIVCSNMCQPAKKRNLMHSLYVFTKVINRRTAKCILLLISAMASLI